MTEHNVNQVTETHWLNWCRLCAKDDVRGNVKVCTSENANNAWNSRLVTAIRKYFDVHMQLEDELSGALCNECYTLISELIDFAEHVNKAQAIFEVLRRSEPSDHLDVEALRRQYGLREADWTHIIKPVLDIGNTASKTDLINVPKKEIIDLNEDCESETPEPLESLDEGNVNILPNGEMIIPDWDPLIDTQNNTNKRMRGRRRTCNATKADYTMCESEAEPSLVLKLEITDEKPIIAGIGSNLEFLSESQTTSFVEPEIQFDVSSGSDRPDFKTKTDDSDSWSKRKRVECKWCNKVYHNPASYQKHIQQDCRKLKQRTKMDKNAICELCNKTLASSSALKLHIERMHQDSERFTCDHCGKQLKTVAALEGHKLVNAGERPLCSMKFKNKDQLKIHSKTHQKPIHECNICGKNFQTARSLTLHNVVHSEDRKFKCDVCDMLFKRSKTLRRHLLTHTELKPFVCHYCDQPFRCNYNLRVHKLHMHPHEFKEESDADLPSRLKIPTLDELRAMTKLQTDP